MRVKKEGISSNLKKIIDTFFKKTTCQQQYYVHHK